MTLSLYDTMARAKRPFVPADPKRVTMYVCGPTVYNYAHIGNFRAYAFEDLLQRHLEFRGYEVNRVMNLTDVDDKTIRGCRHLGMRLADFTGQERHCDIELVRIECAQAIRQYARLGGTRRCRRDFAGGGDHVGEQGHVRIV
jgi:cysteinyl-tRNA synthetase